MLREYRKDLPYYVLSKGTMLLSWLFIVWLLTHSLTPAQYGDYALLYSLLTVFAIVTTSWLNSSIYRYLPEFTEKSDLRRFRAIIYRLSKATLLIGLALFAVLLAASAVIGIVPPVALLLLAVSFAFVCHSAYMLIIAYLSAKRLLRPYTFATVSQVALFALVIGLLIGPFEDKTLMVFVALILSYLPTIILAARKIEFERIAVSGYAKEYMRYGLPLMLVSAGQLINMYGDQYVIRWFGSSADVGIYSANYVFAERSILSLSSVMMVAYLPILFRTWDSGAQDEAYRFIWKIVLVLLAVLTPVELVLIAYGDAIARLFIDPQFSAGNVIIPVIGLATLISNVAAVFADVLTVQKRTGILAACYLFAAGVNILLNILFVPHYGFIAAAYTTLASCIILLVIILSVAHKYGRIFDHALRRI